MEEQNKIFIYNYSASEQKEIENIRKIYAPPSTREEKMERLRKLDESATKPGTIAAFIMGTIGILMLGIGICCCLAWSNDFFLLGIILGIFGIANVSLPYPLYNHVTKKWCKKIAPEILRLADELSSNNS